MNAWSLVAAWVTLSVPVSMGLGLVLARARGEGLQSLPARVPATTGTR